jgi:hypothetical protein
MGDALLQSAENRVISELRRKTEQFIKDIGRPQQLYNIDKSKTALIVVLRMGRKYKVLTPQLKTLTG